MLAHHSRRLVQRDILEILRKYTDKDHTMSQQAIQKKLADDYEIEVDRKTVRRHLLALREADSLHIQCAEDITRHRKGQEQEIFTNWYYRNEFSEGELRFLIDSVLFSDALPGDARKALIEKLEGLSNQHFHSIISKIDREVYSRPENKDFLKTLQTLENGITEEKKVAFSYRDYGTDCKPHFRLNADGTAKRYTVSPYQLIRAIGHSYLVCNVDGYDDLTHFRIDRIVQSELLDSPARPLRCLPGWNAGMRLSEYLMQHPNLWNSEVDTVTIRCPQYLMNDIVDSFGTKVMVFLKENDMMHVRLRIDEEGLLHWALQFAEQVEILKPKRLRDRMKEILQDALKKYEGMST